MNRFIYLIKIYLIKIQRLGQMCIYATSGIFLIIVRYIRIRNVKDTAKEMSSAIGKDHHTI